MSREELLVGLTRAAAQVLLVIAVEPEDDFFDLGGSSLTALAFALETERSLGLKLSPTCLYDTPRFADLADALINRDGAPARQLVLAKPGSASLPPVFLAPGMGSSASQVLALGAQLAVPNAVYALEPPGLEGDTVPFTRLEDGAAHFAAVIDAALPGVRCHLVGFCFGGLLALELARVVGSDRVASLTLINSFPHARYWPMTSRLGAWSRLVRRISVRSLWDRLQDHHLPALRARRPAEAASYAASLLGRGLTLPFRIFALTAYAAPPAGAPAPTPRIVEAPALLDRLKQASREAFAAYRPAIYDGTSLLITPGGEQHLPFDPARYWPRFLRNLTLRTVPGDQAELLGVHLDQLSTLLSRFIADHRG